MPCISGRREYVSGVHCLTDIVHLFIQQVANTKAVLQCILTNSCFLVSCEDVKCPMHKQQRQLAFYFAITGYVLITLSTSLQGWKNCKDW